MRSIQRIAIVVGALLAGCSLIYDFDDLEGLPCGCLPGFVCLPDSNTCVAAGAVDDFKSCTINATPNPDDQCQTGSECVEINTRGARCLPRCTPRVPILEDVGTSIRAECGDGRFCWEVAAGVGYCDDGECNDLPNDCPAPQRCVRINGAGVCFEACDILSNADPCGPAPAHCQPVTEGRTMACLPSGDRQAGEVCGTSEGACAAADDLGRGLICARPMNSTSPLRTCVARCNPALGNADCPLQGETCFPLTANIDDLGTDLGICQGS